MSQPDPELTGELYELGLGEHAEAFAELGFTSIRQIGAISEQQEDDLQVRLEEEKVPRRVLRALTRWIAQKKSATPAVDSRALHFYGLRDRLNEGDASFAEELTILRVDIEPFVDTTQSIRRGVIRIPGGAMDTQIQIASSSPIPLVSLVGPTGTGKSFIASSFMAQECGSSKWPIVARAGQTIPTSAHVSLHRGFLQPGTPRASPVVLLDFEGEDGRIPRNLLEVGLRRLHNMSSTRMTDEAMKSQVDGTIKERQHIVKDVLPSFAYLVSDVVIFIDTVEPRREERAERIRHFAENAHKIVKSIEWRPALILLQNKWVRLDGEDAKFDVTDDYDWLVESLGMTFSSVAIVRIPALNDTHNFENGLETLHTIMESRIQAVGQLRIDVGCLYSEHDFWFGFHAMAHQFYNGMREGDVESLGTKMVKTKASNNSVDNAAHLLLQYRCETASDFHNALTRVMNHFVYVVAAEVRCTDHENLVRVRHGLQALYEKILQGCLPMEPCSVDPLTHDGRRYPCLQRRAGHGASHTNPAMVRVSSQNLLKRLLSLGFWKDRVPCTWKDDAKLGFQGQPPRWTFSEFAAKFDQYVSMTDDEYQYALLGQSWPETKTWQVQNVCQLCLSVSADLVILPHGLCRHMICRRCIMKRKSFSGEQDEVVCPFCGKSSICRTPPCNDYGLRLLSLDGGGVRGIAELAVLQCLEERLCPLRISDLFDVIIGTSIGGIISMGLLSGLSLDYMDTMIANMAKEVLDKKSWFPLLNDAMNIPLCDTEKMESTLKHVFGNQRLFELRGSSPPYYFCTLCDTSGPEACVAGNLPMYMTAEPLRASSLDIGVSFGGEVWEHARGTSAAPRYFYPYAMLETNFSTSDSGKRESVTEYFEYVDGGVLANCPASLGVQVVMLLELARGKPWDTAKNFVEMIASVGTGLQEPSIETPFANGLTWAGRLINFALDSEMQWKRTILDAPDLDSVPKVRINPPGVGSLDPFTSESIPQIRKAMKEFITSDRGKKNLDKFSNLTFSKLFIIRQTENMVVGERMRLTVRMRDVKCEFEKKSDDELKEILRNRCVPFSESWDHDRFVEEANKAFRDHPFVPPFPGRFAYMFAGAERELLPLEKSFTLESSEAGVKPLNVVWRTEAHGDMPICGFPRSIRVLENAEQRSA